MGLTWNLSAAIATIALILISGAVWNKARQKKDSPLYRLVEKLRRKKPEDDMIYDEKKYRRLSLRSGLKWGLFII